MELEAVDLAANSAEDRGGGLRVGTDATVSLERGNIAGNTAGSAGGGAWLSEAHLTAHCTSWGVGAEDNDPDDIWLDSASTNYTGLGEDESFRCDADACE